MSRRLLAGALVATVLAALPLPASAEERGGLETRVFTVRWRSLNDAATLATPLLSTDATLQLQPKLGALTVTDWPSNVAAFASALDSFDVPPRAIDVTVLLLRATSAAPGKPISEELRSIKDSVDPVTPFSSYEVLGEAKLSGVEGGDVSTTLGGNEAYRVGFRVGAVDDRNAVVRLDDLSLARKRRGTTTYDDVMTLTYNAPSAEKVVLGVTRAQARDSGVLLVIEAVIRPAPGASEDVAGKTAPAPGERSR